MEVSDVTGDSTSARPVEGLLSAGLLSDGALPCGVPLDELFAQVTDGRTARAAVHQRSCLHCRATLAELDDIWMPVNELAAEEVQAPAGLLQTVTDRIRELSRNPWYASLPGPQGYTRVAARVVGAIARLAADSVPRVSSALGQGRAGPSLGAAELSESKAAGATGVGVAGGHVVVDVQIVVDLGSSIPEVARQVQRQISRDLDRHAELTTVEVNVEVIDVRIPGQ
jgi:uncharacterized alkaline shock family protein YloU